MTGPPPARPGAADPPPARPGAAEPTLAEICVVACAQAWRGDGAILASPMGLIPTLGARLARLTFAPELLLTDGEATLLAPDGATEGWLPYRDVLRLVATGRRHMMMGAAQIDRFGNQNISCIGDWARPKAQLLGVRGAPGNTINHPVSYWIPRHSARVLVERVDMVSGIGYDRAATLPGAGTGGQRAGQAVDGRHDSAAWHEIRLVVTDKAVLDFVTPDHSMRVRSVHPGVSVEQVQALTGFALTVPDELAVTPIPTAAELALIRERLDPAGLADRELS
jgi:acyl CoA:acetate/3-ketoacid CoA transferase beta subunit